MDSPPGTESTPLPLRLYVPLLLELYPRYNSVAAELVPPDCTSTPLRE